MTIIDISIRISHGSSHGLVNPAIPAITDLDPVVPGRAHGIPRTESFGASEAWLQNGIDLSLAML
jgi:hypothetical protein